MAMLVTVPELSLWAEGDAASIDPADPLAIWLLESASELVMDECGFPDWTAQTAPRRAKIVIANIAKRCWNNADQEIRTAIAGGPSSALIDEAALGLRLSDAEIAECAKIATKENGTTAGGRLWTLPTTRGPVETRIFVPDNYWPMSSPINYLDPAGDPEYVPTYDEPLPVGVLPQDPVEVFEDVIEE